MIKWTQILCNYSCLLLLVACSQQVSIEEVVVEEELAEELFVKTKDEYSSFVQQIIGNDSIGFRGVLPSMTMSEVRGIETAQHEETDSLIVRFVIDDGIENNAELEYYFNNDSVFSKMEMTIFCTREGARDSLYDDYLRYNKENKDFRMLVDGYNFQVDTLDVHVTREGTVEFPNILIQLSTIQ